MFHPSNSFRGKQLTHTWSYKDLSGTVLGYVARYDGSDENKEIVPYFKKQNESFEMGGALKPRPLFGLWNLLKKEEPVLIVEGEKCASALHSLNIAAISSCGGSQQVNCADWSPLNGFKTVYLIPDNDEPGDHYVQEVHRQLLKLPQPPDILLVRFHSLEEHGDIVDWIQEFIPKWNGFDPIPEEHHELLKKKLEEIFKGATPIPEKWKIINSDSSWPLPIPLEEHILPPWPDIVFHEPLNDFVKELSLSTETPSLLGGLLTLSAVATAVAGKYHVSLKTDYQEPLNLWTCIAMPPASLKTGVLKVILEPLAAWEMEQRNILEPKIKETESLHRTLTERIQQKRKKVGNLSNEKYELIQKEILELEKKIPVIPTLPRLWVGDVTAERLASLMAEQDERMAIFLDEGGIFENMAGRYSGGIPNLDIFLQGHSASSVRVSRQGRASLFLNHPTLTMGLAVQPEVLRGLAGKKGFRGKGLLARFLYAIPPSNLGYRTRQAPSLSLATKQNYQNMMNALLNLPWAMGNEGKISQPLFLSSEAQEFWNSFALRVEKDLRPGGQFENIQDWAGKLPGAVARISGLIHMARHALRDPRQHPIYGVDMEAAIALAEVVSIHTLSVFDLMGADPAFEGARLIKKWITERQQATFTVRDCQYHFKSRFQRKRDLESPLEILVEHHMIRRQSKVVVPHRPSEIYEVNPVLLS